MPESCSWDISYAECATTPDQTTGELVPDCFQDASVTERQRFETMATDYLWRWTGRSLGLCPTVVRPCKETCWDGVSTWSGTNPSLPAGSAPLRPVLIQGQWFNLSCGVCGDDCSCSHLSKVVVPGPVYSVEEILIDGQPIPLDGVRVDDYRVIVSENIDLPTCQDMSRVPTAPDTWQIRYTRGSPVPVGGQIAAGILACEFYKAACNDASCQLPQRLQTITRQGVTIATVLDDFSKIDEGRTGIWLIDSWVSSVTKLPRRSTVRSVDLPARKVVTTTWRTLVLPPDESAGFGVDGFGVVGYGT